MSPLWISAIILLATVQNIAALECHSCSDVDNLGDCHNTSQCIQGQSCFTNLQTTGQTQTFTLGCTDNAQCVTITGSNPGIIGRGIDERQTHQCHECCGSNYCNNALCSHLRPTTCIDDVKVDCPFLNTLFNICQDIHHAKTVCPAFCQLCSLVDGNWAEWSPWSNCSVTCENGTQTRIRTCTHPAPSNGGLDCEGKNSDIKVCLKQPCPVHGGWTDWSEWGTCSATCEVGIKRRIRNCTNPYPLRNGNHCFGDAVDDIVCLPGPCANGGWSDWNSWTTCSASCGGGLRSQSRTCTQPRPSAFGKFCEGDSSQMDMCNKQSCEPSVAFNAYSVTDITPINGQILVFSTVLTNDGSAYNNSTGVFTAPINGTYSFSAQICARHGHDIKFDIVVEDVVYSSTHGYDVKADICYLAQAVATVRKNEWVAVKWAGWPYASINVIIKNTYNRSYFTGKVNGMNGATYTIGNTSLALG